MSHGYESVQFKSLLSSFAKNRIQGNKHHRASSQASQDSHSHGAPSKGRINYCTPKPTHTGQDAYVLRPVISASHALPLSPQQRREVRRS